MSNRYLTAPLSREQAERLRPLGWRPPTVRKWPNYYRLWTVLSDPDRRAIAAIALDTLAQLPQFGKETARPSGRAVRISSRRRHR